MSETLARGPALARNANKNKNVLKSILLVSESKQSSTCIKMYIVQYFFFSFLTFSLLLKFNLSLTNMYHIAMSVAIQMHEGMHLVAISF